MQPQTRIDPKQVPGWGIDADPNNEPTYPMRKRVEGEHSGTWERPPQQPANIEILYSNERKNLPAVFGTSSPPTGLSGMIRREAFRFSESSYGHWLPLMLADRVDMVEGIIHDLAHGHVPNVYREMGGRAAWTYERSKVISIALVGGAVACLALAYVRRRRNGNDDRQSGYRSLPDERPREIAPVIETVEVIEVVEVVPALPAPPLPAPAQDYA